MPTTTVPALKPEVTTADVLNMIRKDASQSYQNDVPVANINDINTLNRIGQALLNFAPHRNYFIEALYNRIAVVWGRNKIYTNPLKFAKRGTLDLGETIEEFFVDLVQAHNYDMSEAQTSFMKIEKSNVKTAFHNMNFQKFYKCTITRDNIKMAFLSWDGVNQLIDMMVQVLYTTCYYHEYLIMKHMMGRAILNGAMYAVPTPAFNWTNAKQVTAKVRQISNDMEKMSRKRNVAGVANFTDKSRQIVVMTSEAESIIDVEVLAATFNVPYADFLSNYKVTIDAFNAEEEAELAALFTGDNFNPDFKTFTTAEITSLNAVPAWIISRDWFVILDNLLEFTTSPYNNEGLYYNNTLHKWSTFSISPFEEAVVFAGGTPTVTAITIVPASATVSPGTTLPLQAQVTTTNFAPQTVTWSLTGSDGNSTIDYTGNLVVGIYETATSLTVTATSTFDSTVSKTATITISQPTS